MALPVKLAITVMLAIQYAVLQVVCVGLVSDMVTLLLVLVQTLMTTFLFSSLQCAMELRLPLSTLLTLPVSCSENFGLSINQIRNMKPPDVSMNGWHSRCFHLERLNFGRLSLIGCA